MILIEEDNCNIMYSENIPYIRIDISGLLHTGPLIDRLSNPKLFALLTGKQVQNVLLNFSQALRVGTDDLRWIEDSWLTRLSEAGVQKVSIVTTTQNYEMLVNVFHGMEESASKTPLQVHIFNDDQFYNGWEAVNWF